MGERDRHDSGGHDQCEVARAERADRIVEPRAHLPHRAPDGRTATHVTSNANGWNTQRVTLLLIAISLTGQNIQSVSG
jgi:hypothetical protein